MFLEPWVELLFLVITILAIPLTLYLAAVALVEWITKDFSC